MKDDMLIFNVTNIERSMPDKKEFNIINREQIKAENSDSSISGYDRSKEAENASFRETMMQAKQKVRQMVEKPQKEISSRDDMEECRENGANVKAKVKIENFVASESTEKKESMSKTVSMEQGKLIALDAITAISEMLNLSPDIINGLKDLSIGVLSEAVIEQFSEILCALKGISSLLEQAAQNSVALDINGKVIEPHQAAELEKGLRVELFRLQLALEALGIAGDVSRSAAFKMNLPVDGGIPQAINPASINMPEAQLKAALGGLLKNNGEQIASVIARMSALAKGEAQDGVSAGKAGLNTLLKSQGIDESQAKIINIATVQKNGEADIVSTSAAKPADLCTLSSQVMRQLLKIDGNNGQEVSKGANANEAKVPLTLNPALSSDQKQDQKIIQILKPSTSQSDQVTGIEAFVKTESQASEMNAKLQPMLFKTLEENVMFQVTQKLSNAVKNNFHEIRIVLKPESLGEMRMTIKMEGDIVMARITVENQQVKQIIESNLQDLKNSLQENNLQAGAFDVNVSQGHQNEADNSQSFGKDADLSKNNVESGEEAIANMKSGLDTGRRFGSNTIEYFA